jgi:hypothetical protein
MNHSFRLWSKSQSQSSSTQINSTIFIQVDFIPTLYKSHSAYNTQKMAVSLRSLSVYSIPPDLLAALQVRSIQARDTETEPSTTAEPERDGAEPAAAVASSSGLGCQTCPGASFEHPDEQRAHFKSDWHRYNAKARGQAKAVTADEWDGMVEGECGRVWWQWQRS